MGRFSVCLVLASSLAIIAAIDLKYCSTPECVESARFFEKNINPLVDPCDNFYEYTCGNYHSSKLSVAGDKETNSTTRKEKLFANLDKNLDRIKDYPSSSYTLNIFKGILKNCQANQYISERNGKKLIRELFSDIDLEYADWKDLLVFAVKKFRMNTIATPFFKFSVESKNEARKELKVQISDPIFAESSKERHQKQVEYVKSVFKFFCDDSSESLGVCRDYEKEIHSIIELDTLLRSKELPKRNLVDYYRDWWTENHSKDVALMKYLFKMLDWDDHLDARAVVEDSAILNRIAVIQSADEKVLALYALYTIIEPTLGFVSDEFRSKKSELQPDTAMLKTRQEFCLESPLGKLFHMAVYQELYPEFFNEKTKEIVGEMVEDIHQAFRKRIRNSEWMDDETQERALKKLKNIKKNIAFPDFFMDKEALDDFYHVNQEFHTQVIEEPNYLKQLVLFGEHQTKQEIKKLSKTSTNDGWYLQNLLMDEIKYDPVLNSLLVPMGALQRAPWFHGEGLPSLNFGSIGTIIAQVFTHAFDKQGSAYDENGELNNWWTSKTQRLFHKKEECFKQQYNAQIDPATNLHMNGTRTLANNIADNGGLSIALEAFLKREIKNRENIMLSDMRKYNTEQLFYLSWASMYCEKISKQTLREQIQKSDHVPNRVRVILMAYNSEHFRQTFDCPALDKKDTCALW